MSANPRPQVVITHWVHDSVLDWLGRYAEVVPNSHPELLPSEELLRRATNAEGLMMFMPDHLDATFLDACPRLRVIGAALKGYDNFDVDACTERGVWFCHVPDLLTEATAELCIGLTLGLARNILAGDRRVRSGAFVGWRPVLYGTGLAGSTVGLLGMGAVGRAIAKRLRGFDPALIYHDKVALDADEASRLAAKRVSLEDLLSRSDFILVSLPLTSETRHLLNRERMRQIKPGCRIINVGRGSVVDEHAVAEALQDGRLAGYAADVFEFEDWALADRPPTIPLQLLAQTDTTVFTPHLGSAVNDIRRRIAQEAAEAIVEALQGKVPRGAVNSLTGKRSSRIRRTA